MNKTLLGLLRAKVREHGREKEIPFRDLHCEGLHFGTLVYGYPVEGSLTHIILGLSIYTACFLLVPGLLIVGDWRITVVLP